MTITLNITGSGVTPTLGKPTLTLVSNDDTGDSNSDNTTRVSTPLNFNMVLPDGYIGTTIELYDGPTLLDSIETAGTSVLFTGVTFAEGVSDPRVRYTLEGGTVVSPKSDSLFPLLTVDLTPPSLSSASGTKTGSTTATLDVTTDSPDGRIFWIADTNTSTPTADQVIAGKEQSGGTAYKSGSVSVSSSGSKSINVTVLASSTTFKGFIVHRDAAGNKSDVIATGTFTTDGATQVVSSDPWGVSWTNQLSATFQETTQDFDIGWAFVYFAGDANAFDVITFDGDAADQTGGTVTNMWAAKYYDAPGSHVIRMDTVAALGNVAIVGCTVNGLSGVTGSSGPTHHPGAADPQTFGALTLSAGDLGMVFVSSMVVAGTQPVIWTGVTTANTLADGNRVAASEITGTWGSPTASAAGAVDFNYAFGTFVMSLKWSL